MEAGTMTTQTTEALDLDMLAVDLAKMLDRYGYDIDASADDIRAALPAFVAQIRANAATIGDEPGDDAATWAPVDDTAAPVVQYGRRPRVDYLPWHRSQTVDMATERDGDTFTHYWGCPKRGCSAWAGPYTDASECKRTGMGHVYYTHDLPAAQATEQRRAERRASR